MNFEGNVFQFLTINRVKKERYIDEELIEGLRAGEDATLKFLYKNYFEAVKKFILKTHGTEEQAQDIFQEVIIVIYNKLQNGNFKITSSFFTFFYAVVKNTWLDFRKMKAKNPLGYALEFNDELDASLGFDDLELLSREVIKSNLFDKHFKKLSDSCQKLLTYVIADYKAEEIANELGFKSANYVGKRKWECLDKLIEGIKNDSVFEELI